MANTLNAARLREVLSYDPETGVFTWRVQRGGVRHGDIAGTLSKRGYVRIFVDGKQYQGHRLAWLHVHGEWPASDIDHINGRRSDNRIENLRDVPGALNSENRHTTNKQSKSGHLGVYQVGSKFIASISVAGKPLKIGRFPTPEEASAAYLSAKRQLHKGCTI